MLRGLVFFFQAEDGIRDYKVTGVQTCALPIWSCRPRPRLPGTAAGAWRGRGKERWRGCDRRRSRLKRGASASRRSIAGARVPWGTEVLHFPRFAPPPLPWARGGGTARSRGQEGRQGEEGLQEGAAVKKKPACAGFFVWL